MQKNWYIVYTRPKNEKKVVNLLTKKKIENFCPLNRKLVNSYRKSKMQYEPLFDSYVFVYITESEISYLKNIDGVVNVVYWKGQPAVIPNEEVEAIKEFTSAYSDIKLQRTSVNYYNKLESIEDPSYIIEGNLVMIKNRSFKVNLPSMGFTMSTDVQRENGRSLEGTFSERQLRLQS